MTTVLFIILGIVLAGIIIVFYIIRTQNKNYYNEYKEIYLAHEKIQYPTLTKEEQFRILDDEDYSPINKLTPFEFVPDGLLNHYITIEPIEYFEHLKKLDLPNKININHLSDKLYDGFYIEIKANKYYYIFNDRRTRVFEKCFNTLDDLLKYLTNDRFKTYVPKLKRKLS